MSTKVYQKLKRKNVENAINVENGDISNLIRKYFLCCSDRKTDIVFKRNAKFARSLCFDKTFLVFRAFQPCLFVTSDCVASTERKRTGKAKVMIQK